MLRIFLEIIIISVVTILLAGEVIAILNIYRISGPFKKLFRKGKLRDDKLTYEEKTFLLRDLEFQEKLAEREEQKISRGEIIGSISECRRRKYLLQRLITKIKAAPLYYHWSGYEIAD